MNLVDPFIVMARDAGLVNAADYDPIAPTFTAHAGDYALVVSAMPESGRLDERDARVSISWGLDGPGSPEDWSSLRLIHDFKLARWRLEYDLKGTEIPCEIRDLARRFDLPDSRRAREIGTANQVLEIGKALIAFIALETDRLARRPSGRPSKIPLPAFLASGQKLP